MKIIDTSLLTPTTKLSADEASWVYNGLDCCVTAEIHDRLSEIADNISNAVYDLSKSLQAPILEMMVNGILIDKPRRDIVRAQFQTRVDAARANLDVILRDGYGVEMNSASPSQLAHLLYDRLKLPVQKKRDAHGRMAPTTDRAALEHLSTYLIAEPLINHILYIRDLAKKISFLETTLDADGRFRCNYNIAGTKTGRLASAFSDFDTGSNTQNIDRELRVIFIAGKGKKFVNVDLEQADSRHVGANCWNKFYTSHGAGFAGAYLDACESGDLHTTVTRMAWRNLAWGSSRDRDIADGIAYRDKSYRDLAKGLGHGSNYYGKPPTMAKQSKLPLPLVKAFQHDYFEAFPCIPEGHKHTAAALRTGAITTIHGRRRYFFGRLDDDKTLRDAIAYEGQSPTADAINVGTMRAWREGKNWPGFRLLAQVHDSLLFEIDAECEDDFVPWLVETLRVKVPLVAGREFYVPTEAKTGWNWGDFSPKNPDGMRKYKGADTRQRQMVPLKGWR